MHVDRLQVNAIGGLCQAISVAKVKQAKRN